MLRLMGREEKSNMAINVVAYIGIENTDNILYLSRILVKLGKKVLIVDHTEPHAFMYSFPKPEGISYLQNFITYRKVDYTSMTVQKEVLEEYDDVLISYGFNAPLEEDIELCNRYIYVTDLYSYNHERIQSLSTRHLELEQSHTALLIKEAAEIKISPDRILEKMYQNIPVKNISVLYRDEKDYSNSLSCHYNGVVRFKDISKQLKNHLLQEVINLHPEIEYKIIQNAYRQARKGD